MREQQHPIVGSSKFLMKRWTRYSIYSKSGPHIRANYVKSGSYGWDGKTNNAINETIDVSYDYTNNTNKGSVLNQPSPINVNLYQTCSIYLYDYVIVSDNFYYSNVYTASVVDSTPNYSSEWVGTLSSPNLWIHNAYTFKNSPNAITNNYVFGYTRSELFPPKPIFENFMYRDDGVYFEIVKGYPRNHFTHKRDLFSLYSFKTIGKVNDVTSYGYYVKNRQSSTSTVGLDGLEDGSLPIQSIQVGNLKLVQTDNVINH